MKRLTRLVFGVLSSALFCAGFMQAASRVDPLSRERAMVVHELDDRSANDCTSDCVG